jgi:hypothetical protein
MTDAELLAELAKRKAIIVHCSRPGKGDEGIGGLLFPKDLQKAIRICANKSKELCCSVVWPEHIKTFGAVGIILRPRSIKSITSICTIDGATHFDPEKGKRVGLGSPFSRQGVIDTFTKATDYNEWNVQDADTIGIFVHPRDPWDVAKKVSLEDIPGFEPSMGDGEVVGTARIDLTEIGKHFPGLPIYTFSGADIVKTEGLIPVNASDLYHPGARQPWWKRLAGQCLPH